MMQNRWRHFFLGVISYASKDQKINKNVTCSMYKKCIDIEQDSLNVQKSQINYLYSTITNVVF